MNRTICLMVVLLLALGLASACAPTTRYSTWQSLNALNRSLKSGLTAISTSHRIHLGNHFPRGAESTFCADRAPELPVHPVRLFRTGAHELPNNLPFPAHLPKSFKTRIAALWPAAPMTEPAGWQPALHEYSPAIGVVYGRRSAKPNELST